MAQSLIDDPATAELPPRARALVDDVIKLTQTPAKMLEADVQALRDAGLDDRAILDANMICGYFAFVNRLADGLGVPLEDFWKDEPNP
jgi:uncharacterized peroxidase-related enzyme